MDPVVLILVLSCKKPPYDELHEAQRRTWDSVTVDGVETVYYWCNELHTLTWDFKLALDDVWVRKWDIIFRTNSSSYVDKTKLVEFARTLSDTCYCGVDGDGFASGSGFFISRSIAHMLRSKLPEQSQVIEDVVIGELLSEQNIAVTPGAKRYDYWKLGENVDAIRASYHLRCKGPESSVDPSDRSEDLLAFQAIHEIKSRELP